MGGVDLFISIHHDDVQPVYYSKWDYNGKTYHFSDKFAGYSIFVSYLRVRAWILQSFLQPS